MSRQEKSNIYQKINAVMSEVTYIQKSDKKVNNQYRFVSHDQVTAAIRESFVKHGIVCVSSVESFKQDGNRTEVQLIVKLVNMDNPQDFVEIRAFGFGIDPGDKGPGKAISYAFKYAMLKTFCIETGDDPDFEPNQKHVQVQIEPEEYFNSWGDESKNFKMFAEEVAKIQKWNLKDAVQTFVKNPNYTRQRYFEWKNNKKINKEEARDE